jgi:hypothetical protein
MEPLTQKYGVVIPDVAPAPLAGYKVCVFEETQGGTKFRAIINPGESPLNQKGFWLFKKEKKYTCVAVNCDVNLRFDFDIPVKLAAQIEHFTLHCHVNYRVTDPEPMALAYKSDPLLRLQKEIGDKFQENILKSKITIDEVFNNFYDIKQKILSPTTFNTLYKFFGSFGAILEEINMTYTIPDKYLEPLKKEEEYKLKKKTDYIDQELHFKELQRKQAEKRETHGLRRIEYEHEKEELLHRHELKDLENVQEVKNTYHHEQMEDARSMHKFGREMTERVITAIDNAVESIDGAGSLEQVAKTAINVVQDVKDKFGGRETGQPAKLITGDDTRQKQLQAVGNSTKDKDSFKEARQALAFLTGKVEDAPIPEVEKDDALSCIRHLQAEVFRKEKADITLLQSYAGQLFERLHKHRQLFNHSVFEKIKELKEVFANHFDAGNNTAEDKNNQSQQEN